MRRNFFLLKRSCPLIRGRIETVAQETSGTDSGKERGWTILWKLARMTRMMTIKDSCRTGELLRETETQVTVCNPRSLRHFRYTLAHFSESQLFTMSANFVGKYQRTSAEKYEEFLTALGVNFLLRKAATVSTPVMEVRKDNVS